MSSGWQFRIRKSRCGRSLKQREERTKRQCTLAASGSSDLSLVDALCFGKKQRGEIKIVSSMSASRVHMHVRRCEQQQVALISVHRFPVHWASGWLVQDFCDAFQDSCSFFCFSRSCGTAREVEAAPLCRFPPACLGQLLDGALRQRIAVPVVRGQARLVVCGKLRA